MNSLRVNARVALFCLGAIGWSAESAWAADVAAGEEETLEEVVVTGTNIRGVAPTGSALIAIDRETIDNSSAVTVTSMLLDTPQVMNFGITESSRSGNGGSGNITFGSGINIRGISPFGTLTLLNGRRIPPNGTGGAAPDPNVIPTIALERIEIIADGASAVYGSDAIAGVANLVLRRNVKGFEANVRYGAGSGYSDRLLNAIWGHSWGSGRVTIAAENGFHTALKGPDRSFLRSDQRDAGGSDYRVAQCAQGNLTIGNLPTTGGTVYPIPASGVTAATLVAGNRNLCDNIKNLDIIPKQDHRTAAVTFDQAINQTVDVFAEGYFARRDYERNVPTPTLSNAVVPTTNAFYIRPATAPAAGNLVVNYSFARDYGPTNKLFNSYGYAETYYVLGGARVKLPADWRAELTVSYGRDKEQNNGTASLNTAAITTALASNNPATSLNVYGTTVNDPTLLANLADRVAISPGRSIARNVTLAFDGKLFSMPGGDARAAVGVGRLYSSLYGGQVTGGVAAPASLFVFSERVVKSVYVEFALPLVGEGNAVRGVRSLQLSLAGRQENYTEFGKTSHPKVGLDYSPVAGLKLHASYGTAFRAPGLVQLKGLATPGFFSQNYQDPLANNGAGGTTTGIAINGSNPNLLPEKATTYSAGIEWAPEGKPFGVSLNYFDIDYRGQIVGYLSNLSIVGNPAAFEGVVYKRRPSDAAGSAANQ
jgi:iron complex outermembrane receptor protein